MYESSIQRFVIRFADRRRVMVRKINAILNMAEDVQRGLLDLGVPYSNVCENTQTLIRRIRRKFSEIVKDEYREETITGWSLDKETQIMTVMWSDKVEEDFLIDTIITREGLVSLQQICSFRALNIVRSLATGSLEKMIQLRLRTHY
ncbi:hypothetical protein Hanom_Chr01g00014921 [Helianthus anomalus]